MALDEALAERLRDALGGLPGLSEKRMMGGLVFLLDGNMLAGANRDRESGQGHFLFRVGKENAEAAEARPEAIPMIMNGRRMGGFYHVHEEAASDAALAAWVALALSFVKTLPAKE